jgi:hypothetical protein
MERSKVFYEALGLCFSRHAHGGGPEHYAHEDERGVVELYPRGKVGEGDMTGLGFAVEDLEGQAERLRGVGFEPGAIGDRPWGRSFVVRDPDGRRVEVTAVGKS